MEGSVVFLPVPGSRRGKRRMDFSGVTREDSNASLYSERSIGRAWNLIRHMDFPVIVGPSMLGLFSVPDEKAPNEGWRMLPLEAPI